MNYSRKIELICCKCLFKDSKFRELLVTSFTSTDNTTLLINTFVCRGFTTGLMPALHASISRTGCP